MSTTLALPAGAAAAPVAGPAPKTAPKAENAVLGIVLILASTFAFAASDTASKFLAGSLPATEVVWLRYLGFLLLVLPFACRGGPVRALHSSRPWLQILRGVLTVLSAVLFTLSLVYLPVAEATAINFVSPIFITALSIPVLAEKVGVRRWAAAFVGLAGVLIVVRPGAGSFQLAALLPAASAALWAGAAVITRKIGGQDRSSTTLAYSALVGVLILSCMLPFEWVTPSLPQLGIGALVALTSTAGHWLIVIAYKNANASLLASISYAQILTATLMGLVVFGAVPDAWTLAGSAVIIASGLYTAHRERVRARERRQAAA